MFTSCWCKDDRTAGRTKGVRHTCPELLKGRGEARYFAPKGTQGKGGVGTRHRWEAKKLGIDTDIDDQFAVVVTEAERTQAEWMGRAAMRLASQASAMEVEEVEQAVAPAVETRGGRCPRWCQSPRPHAR